MFMKKINDIRLSIGQLGMFVIILTFLLICVFFGVTKLFPNNFTRNICHLNGMDTQRIGNGVVCVDSDGLLYSIPRLAEIMEKNDG